MVQLLFVLQFGIPLYGASMQGELKYVDSNHNGCSAFHDEFKSELSTYVALVERGGTSYTSNRAAAFGFFVQIQVVQYACKTQ